MIALVGLAGLIAVVGGYYLSLRIMFRNFQP